MNIIVFYEHIARELDGCKSIINELENNYNVKAFNYSIIFEYYKALKIAKKTKIDMIIMPWLYSEKDYELVVPFVDLNPEVVIVNLHHEQIGSMISERLLIPKDETSKNSVIHLVWSEFFKELLIKSGVNEDLIFVTGNIRTDSIPKEIESETDRKQYGDLYDLDVKKKWILYSENRDWVWGNRENMEKVFLKSGCSKEDFENFFRESLASINKTIENIRSLEDDFFDSYEVIYRPHPGTKINNDIDSRIKILNKGSIYQWLKVVDANVVSGSTTIFESDLCGVPSFVDVSFFMNERFQAYGIYDYPKIRDFRELSQILILKNKEPDELTRKYEKYLGIADGNVSKRIAEQLNNLLEYEKPESYKNKYLKVDKIRFIGKFLREKLIEFIVKKNLLDILNWPQYAIRMKADMPYDND